MTSDKTGNEQISLQWKGFLDTPPLWTGARAFSLPQFPMAEIALSRQFNGRIEISSHLILGKRTEIFFRHYLEHHSEEQILAYNEQIFSDKVTVGELDFLLKNKITKVVTHVELVYKFYLYDPSFNDEAHRWIGPNRKDTLLRKIKTLREKQFPLLYRKETRPLLDHLRIIPEEVQQKVCFKGNLFIPYNLRQKKIPLLNNDCIRGYWVRFSDFSADKFRQFQFFSPKKQDWPIDPSHGTTWYSYTEIVEQISTLLKEQRSPLVWMKKRENEHFRFFIVWW